MFSVFQSLDTFVRMCARVHFVVSWLLLATATTAAESLRPMSLDACIRLALERNYQIAVERHGPEIASNQLQLAYGDYDPTLQLSAERGHTESPSVSGAGDDYTAAKADDGTYAASLGGKFQSGLNYSVTANLDESHGDRRTAGDATSPFVPFDSAGGRATFLELRQPLLKNRTIDSSRYTIRVRQTDLRISLLSLRQQIIDVVAAVEQAYFNLAASRANVKVQQAAFDLARQLYEDNARRVQIGVLEPLDEKQAQAQMATSRADLLEAERTEAVQQNTLKNLIANELASWDGIAIEPSDALVAEAEALDATRSRATALVQRPDLRQLAEDIERRKLASTFNRDQIRPQFDLVGTYGHAANGERIGDAAGQLGDGSYPFYAIGVTWSLPLGNRRAKGNLLVSEAERTRAETALLQARQNATIEVDNAIAAARTSYELVGATREARQFAEAALEAGNKKLASGKLRSYELLQLQRDATSARAAEIRALADYNKSISALRQREGMTLAARRVETETDGESRARTKQ